MTNPPSSLTHAWLDLVRVLATTSREHSHHGLRKIVHGAYWEVDGAVWRTGINVPFSKLGYKNDSSKLKRLSRNYLNEEGLRLANEKLRGRVERGSSQTSVGVAMGSGAKSKKSMGFCMQSVVVSHTKNNIRIDVFYRSTEAIQKFVADLKFLHEIVFPSLLKGIDHEQITKVKFHFSNAYVSAMFFPLIYQFEDPAGWLEGIKRVDSKWWRTAAIDLYRMLRDDTKHSFRLHQVMWEYFQRIDVDRPRCKKYLQKFKLNTKQYALKKKEISTETEED